MALESDMGSEEEGPFEQFQKCDNKKCIYYNEEGYCCYETCRTKVENPMAAPMVVKLCQICGIEFTTCMNEMPIQFCPDCLEGLLKAKGHPHDCMFCGASIEDNYSILVPLCDSCYENLKICATGNASNLEKAANMAHCDHCG